MMIMSWDQNVHEHSFARIIYVFADALDLNAMGFFANAELNPEGRPPFKPANLL